MERGLFITLRFMVLRFVWLLQQFKAMGAKKREVAREAIKLIYSKAHRDEWLWDTSWHTYTVVQLDGTETHFKEGSMLDHMHRLEFTDQRFKVIGGATIQIEL